MKLLTVENAKTVKGEKLGYRTGILYLAPHTISGNDVCPYSTPECRALCLYSAGRGRFTNVQTARIRKTKLLFSNRAEFIDTLVKDIQTLVKSAKKESLVPAIRLNGTSDIAWETEEFGGIPTRFPDIQFYDYTKSHDRVLSNTLNNYYLTYSFNGSNEETCKQLLQVGHNVAVVFADVLPETHWEYPVISGDEHDLRFLERKNEGTVVGLIAKGAARKNNNSFVIR